MIVFINDLLRVDELSEWAISCGGDLRGAGGLFNSTGRDKITPDIVFDNI